MPLERLSVALMALTGATAGCYSSIHLNVTGETCIQSIGLVPGRQMCVQARRSPLNTFLQCLECHTRQTRHGFLTNDLLFACALFSSALQHCDNKF